MDPTYQQIKADASRSAQQPPQNMEKTGAEASGLSHQSLIDQLAKLTRPQRVLLHTNTTRLQTLIENFCESMHASVATPIDQLSSQPTVSIKELNQCWLDCWSRHRDLLRDFREGMEFYRQVDPQGIGEYYRRLTSELDACINQLSDVILSGKSDWICQLQEITHRLRHTLSMDANGITGDIRAHLDALEKLTSDNPEAP